jgi:hypothetical protein
VLTTRGASTPCSRKRPVKCSKNRAVFSGPWFRKANSKTDSRDSSHFSLSPSLADGNTRNSGCGFFSFLVAFTFSTIHFPRHNSLALSKSRRIRQTAQPNVSPNIIALFPGLWLTPRFGP